MPLFVPEHLKVYRIVSIDPGLNNAGVATLDIDAYTGEIKTIEAFTIVNSKVFDETGVDDEYHPERTIKLLKMKQAFDYVLQNTLPAEVACESPFYDARRPSGFAPLVEVVNMFYSAVLEHNVNVKFFQYSPLSVKASVKAKAAKNDTEKGKAFVKEAVKIVPEIMNALITDIDLLTEHAIDAIAVGYTHLLQRRKSNV